MLLQTMVYQDGQTVKELLRGLGDASSQVAKGPI
jgi:hypothetical protein